MTIEPESEVPVSGRVVRGVATAFGVIVFAGLIVLAVADASARAFLITAAGILAMIVLGVTFGGRSTPNVSAVRARRPMSSPPLPETADTEEDADR